MPPNTPMTPEEERRSDLAVRRHIKQLLEHIRDFYSTCHMVAVGQLSPAKAKSKAQEVEEKLNEMMQDMLERLGEGSEGPEDEESATEEERA
mgnify:FL=1